MNAEDVIDLDPESQQIRDVYAYYGLAMYLAQNVERSLAIVLALDGGSELMTSWDYDSRLAENFRSTFGTLISKFAASADAKFSALINRLSETNAQRNDLAHHYFWDRAIQFCSQDGCSEMLAELHRIEDEFTALDADLKQLAEEMVRRRGEDVESFGSRSTELSREMLAGTKSLYDPERVPNPIEIIAAQEWRSAIDKPGHVVLIAKNGRHLVPSGKGLCYGPLSMPQGTTVVVLRFDKAFPAIVNPRPTVTSPWKYGIPLANGYVLRVQTRPGMAGKFAVWIQSPRSRASLTMRGR